MVEQADHRVETVVRLLPAGIVVERFPPPRVGEGKRIVRRFDSGRLFAEQSAAGTPHRPQACVDGRVGSFVDGVLALTNRLYRGQQRSDVSTAGAGDIPQLLAQSGGLPVFVARLARGLRSARPLAARAPITGDPVEQQRGQQRIHALRSSAGSIRDDHRGGIGRNSANAAVGLAPIDSLQRHQRPARAVDGVQTRQPDRPPPARQPRAGLVRAAGTDLAQRTEQHLPKQVNGLAGICFRSGIIPDGRAAQRLPHRAQAHHGQQAQHSGVVLQRTRHRRVPYRYALAFKAFADRAQSRIVVGDDGKIAGAVAASAALRIAVAAVRAVAVDHRGHHLPHEIVHFLLAGAEQPDAQRRVGLVGHARRRHGSNPLSCIVSRTRFPAAVPAHFPRAARNRLAQAQRRADGLRDARRHCLAVAVMARQTSRLFKLDDVRAQTALFERSGF